MTQLFLRQIRLDGGTQCRAATDQETVEEYVEALKAGCPFPPIVVFFDGQHYWLADGFHRVAAYLEAGRKAIEADVRRGTLDDAILFAAGANKRHGLRRTNEDKRKAVQILLDLIRRKPEIAQRFTNPQRPGELSARRIADHCGVSDFLVHCLQQATAEPVATPRSGGRAQLERRINEEERRAILAGKLRRADEHLAEALGELEDCDLDVVAEAITAVGEARRIVEEARKSVA